MVRYIKCPRCELNYIDAEKQEYCDVCLKEMKGIDLGDGIDDAEEDAATELCPVCGENMMRAGEKMCEECRKKAEYEEEEPDPDEDDEWREYLDDDTDADLDSEMGQLGEEFGEEFEDDAEEDESEEYEEQSDEDEDMDYVTGDEIYSLGDDDDDDDDDEKEDEDF